jgi:hypothetical protein
MVEHVIVGKRIFTRTCFLLLSFFLCVLTRNTSTLAIAAVSDHYWMSCESSGVTVKFHPDRVIRWPSVTPQCDTSV